MAMNSLEVMGRFIILIVVMVSKVYIGQTANCTLHTHRQFIKCQDKLNKAVLKICCSPFKMKAL